MRQKNTLAKGVSTVVTHLGERVTMLGSTMGSLNVDWSKGKDFGAVKESLYSRLKGGIGCLESQGQGKNMQYLESCPLLPSWA